MSFFKNKLAVTVILLSVAFLIIIVFSFKRGSSSFVENGVGVTLNSIQGEIYKAGSGIENSFSLFVHISDIKNENEKLKKENSDLQEKSIEYDALKSENDMLRSQVNFQSQNAEYKYQGCYIIAKTGGGYVEGYEINKGTSSGIKRGMVAVSDEGYLIGQVTSVSSNYAIVQTLGNENIAVSGYDVSTKEDGIVKGYKESSTDMLAKIYNLDKNSDIKNGDVITTSGIGQFYPKGLRIGYVTNVEDDISKSTKNAYIKPYVDFNKIEELFIIIPKDINNVKY